MNRRIIPITVLILVATSTVATFSYLPDYLTKKTKQLLSKLSRKILFPLLNQEERMVLKQVSSIVYTNKTLTINLGTELNVTSCENNPNMKQKLNSINKLASDYLCVSDTNYEIKGNRHSKHRKYVQLEFRSCHWDHSEYDNFTD